MILRYVGSKSQRWGTSIHGDNQHSGDFVSSLFIGCTINVHLGVGYAQSMIV